MVKLKTILTIIHNCRIRIMGYKFPLTSNYFDEDTDEGPKEYLIYQGSKEALPLHMYEDFQDCTVMGIYPMHDRAKEKEDSSNASVDLLEITINLAKVPDNVILR